MKGVRLGGMYARGGGMRGGGVEDKGGRAGPGTGSMGGKCSVCGDRATKVLLTFFLLLLKIMAILKNKCRHEVKLKERLTALTKICFSP